MKIYIIHGEYSSKSNERRSEYIKKAKEKGFRIIYINDNSSNIKELFTSNSLFKEKRVYILDNPSNLSKNDIAWINKNNSFIEDILIIYCRSKIASSLVNSFNKIDKIEEYKLPKSIFNFLDSFYPKNSLNCIRLFHEILKNEQIEFIFFLLSRHLRDLYWVKTSPSNIYYPSWRVEKLEKQSGKYSLRQIVDLINNFSDIDIKSKTSSGNVTDLLDLTILRKLE